MYFEYEEVVVKLRRLFEEWSKLEVVYWICWRMYDFNVQ